MALSFIAAVFSLFAMSAKGAVPWEFPSVPVTALEIYNYNGVGQSADYARRVVVSESGRIYVVGRGLEVDKQNYLLVRCFNPDGTLRWSDDRALNGFQALDLLVDAADNAYVIGRIYSNSGFPPSHDVALFKFNSEGVSARENVYALDYAEPSITPFYNQNVPTAAAFAPNGKIYISGYVSNENFAEPTDVSHPYIFAINPAGTMSLEWTSEIHEASSFSPVFEEVPVAIAVNAASEVFEVSNHGRGAKGVHLRKVTSGGSNAWADSVEIPAFAGREHTAIAVGLDAAGNPYVVGNVENPDDGNPQVFVARFNPGNGALVWLQTFDFGNSSEAHAAKTLADGSTVVAGAVDSGLEWTVFRVDHNGQLLWEQRPAYNVARNLTLDASGNIYVVGTGSSFPTPIGVAKLTLDGQVLWFKDLNNTEPLPDEETMPPTVAVAANGNVYVTAHRNVAMSDPNEFGASYPVFDLTLSKLSTQTEAPLVKFISPSLNQEVATGAPFPTITVEASSPSGIQKVAIYDRRGTLRAVLTEAPYTINLSVTDDLTLSPVFAVAYDNQGYASVATSRPRLGAASSIIQLESATVIAREGQSFVRLVAKRNSLRGNVAVEGIMSPGTASVEDYNYFGSHDPVFFSFQDGESLAEVEINLVQDTLPEADETFTVTLSNPRNAEIGPISSSTVTILDDDSGRTNPHGRLEFDAWTYRVSENVGAVALKLIRTGGTEGTVSIHYFTQPTQPSSASPGSDYLETQGNLVFGPGETEKSFTMHALKDGKTEIAESFYVTLNSASGGAAPGERGYCLVYIDDAGAPPVLQLPAFGGFSYSTVGPIRSSNPWHFTAVQSSTASDLRVRVQSTTTPNDEESWKFLSGVATHVDSNWTLNTTDVPTGDRYFRARASAPDYLDRVTEPFAVIGPITVLEGIAPFGDFSYQTTSPLRTGTEWTFAIVQRSLISDFRLRVQSSTTWNVESSWSDLPGGGKMGRLDSNWKHVTAETPAGTRFFRVIASAPTYADRVSEVLGPLTIGAALLVKNVVVPGPGTYSIKSLPTFAETHFILVKYWGEETVGYIMESDVRDDIIKDTLAFDAEQNGAISLTVKAGESLTAPAINFGNNASIILGGTINGSVSLISNAGGLIGNDGSTLIGNDGATLIGKRGASLIGIDSGTLQTIRNSGALQPTLAPLIGNDGATLIGNDGASLIGIDSGTLQTIRNSGALQPTLASLIGDASATLISRTGGNIISEGGSTFRPLGLASGKSIGESQGNLGPSFTGVMTVNGDYSQESGAGMSIAIAGTNTLSTGSQDYDQLTVSGRADLGGVIGFGLFNRSDKALATGLYQPALGATFDVVVATNIITHNLIVRGPIWGDGLHFNWSVVNRADGKQALRLVAAHIAPFLAIQPRDTGWEVAYPANFTGYILQRSSTLTTPNWTLLSDSTNRVKMDTTGSAGFFRMLKQ